MADQLNQLDLNRAKVDNKPVKNDEKSLASANLSIIILGIAAAVFTVMIVGVFFVYRRHKRGYKNKDAKVSMNQLESERFADQMAEEDWMPDNEQNDAFESTKFNLTVDAAEVDSRPSSFKYIGATSYDVNEDTIIKTSMNAHM